MSVYLTIDQARCRRCGKCVDECHRHLPVSLRAVSDDMDCIRCFHCYAVCPHHAISLEGNSEIGDSRLLHFLANRRSTRRFQDRKVEGETVELLINAAGYIPSGGNSHSYRFTILTHGTARDLLGHELKKIYAGKRRLLKSKLLRAFLYPFADAKTRAFLRDPIYFQRISYLLDQYNLGDDPVFYNAPIAIMIHSRNLIPTPVEDCVLAAYNIVLMAQTLGLGSCLVSLAQNAINSSSRCKRILGLKPADRIHAVVVVGHPAVEFLRPVPKNPQSYSIAGVSAGQMLS